MEGWHADQDEDQGFQALRQARSGKAFQLSERMDKVRTTLIWIISLAAVSTVAIAATDIPTRYSGSFPSIGRATSITGTFTGKALSLKYTLVANGQFLPVSGNYTCANKSSNATRCDGRYRMEKSGATGRHGVDITWKSGKPSYFHIDKPARR